MRIFIERQKTTCTRTSKGYRIDGYFYRKEIEVLLFQAFFDELEIKIQEGTLRTKPRRARIASIQPIMDHNSKNPTIIFNPYWLDKPPMSFRDSHAGKPPYSFW